MVERRRLRGLPEEPDWMGALARVPKRDWAVGAVMLAVILAYFTVFCVINFHGFERFCTGDMYEDTYVAKLFWEQKTVFPDNWVFGNQYYVITTPVLAALFYGLGCTVNTAMAAATTVMTLLILISFYWMLWPFARWQEALFGCAMLLAAVTGVYIVDTIEGQIFYLMCSYYAAYLITLFVVFGAYARCRRGCSWRAFGGMAAVCAALSFCTGMQSLRQTAIMVLPMGVYELIRWVPRVPEVIGTVRTLRTYQNTRPLKAVMFGKLEREQGSLLALAVCFANLLGWGLVKLMDPASVTIYGEVRGQTVAERIENLQTALRGLQSVTGLKYLSAETWNGFLGGFCLLMLAVVLVALVLRQREGSRREGLFSYLDLCVLSLASVLVISVVTDVALRSIYFFVWYPLAAVSGVTVVRLLRRRSRPVFVLALAVCMLANLSVSYGDCVDDALHGERPVEARVADWIVDHGYTIAYGEWNSVTDVAVWTDGQVTAGAWSWTDKLFRPLEYINPLGIYDEADNQTAIHILTPETLDTSLLHAEMNGVEMHPKAHFVGTDADGEPAEYLLYTSDRQLMEFMPRYRPNYGKHDALSP